MLGFQRVLETAGSVCEGKRDTTPKRHLDEVILSLRPLRNKVCNRKDAIA